MNFSIEKMSWIKKKKFKNEREEMIKKESLHINDLVDYNQFLDLYSKYGNGLKEDEFADVFLDLLKTDYYSLKKNRCKILKKEVVDEKEIELLKLRVIKELGLSKGRERSYQELVDIYNYIPSKFQLVMFAEKVLDVSSHSLSCTKCNETKNATIFNKTDDEYFDNSIDDKELKKIVNKVVKRKKGISDLKDEIAEDRNLHIGDEVGREEFFDLYKIYGKDFSEYDFARTVLGMTEGKARSLINDKIKKAQIWNEETVSLDYLLKIREETIKQEKLYINQSISYEKFKEIYRKHARILSEIDFAEEILDIAKQNYKRLKREESESFILNDIKIPENFYQEAKQCIKQNENVYRGKAITYEEFLTLYEKYGFVTNDVEFAKQALEIDGTQFRLLKNGECKTNRILRSEENDLPEELLKRAVRKLRDVVIREKKLHIEDPMTGKQFLEIYEKYGFGMSQKDFAREVLDIKPHRLDNILRDENQRTIILTNEKVRKDEIKALRKSLFNNSGYCTEDRITYEEFSKLYKLYGGKLSEKQFAEKILFIGNDRLIFIRNNPGEDTEIFCRVKFSDAYLANLKAKLVRENLLYQRQGIIPTFFEKLYKKAHTILSRPDFAKQVLEINRQNYYTSIEKNYNETCEILSVSGTKENKNKFLEWQNKTISEMLQEGYGYEEIAENTNLNTGDLIGKVETLYESELDKSEVSYKYLYESLKNDKPIDKSRIEELELGPEEMKKIKDQAQEEKNLRKIEEKCADIVDEVKDTPSGIKTLRNYISLCKRIYEKEPKRMSKETLSCLQDCLEFLDDDMENSVFFIKVCIKQMEYARANELITFYMQSEKISVEEKSTLRQMRASVREAEKRKQEVNSRQSLKTDRLRTMYNY